MGKVPDAPDIGAKCLCGDCPTYPGQGGFFCAKGKSEAKVRRRGCTCGDCQVFKQFSLVDGYYCDAGAAGEGAQ